MLPSLWYRAAEEGEKKRRRKNWTSSQLLLFSCVTATFSLKNIRLFHPTHLHSQICRLQMSRLHLQTDLSCMQLALISLPVCTAFGQGG